MRGSPTRGIQIAGILVAAPDGLPVCVQFVRLVGAVAGNPGKDIPALLFHGLAQGLGGQRLAALKINGAHAGPPPFLHGDRHIGGAVGRILVDHPLQLGVGIQFLLVVLAYLEGFERQHGVIHRVARPQFQQVAHLAVADIVRTVDTQGAYARLALHHVGQHQSVTHLVQFGGHVGEAAGFLQGTHIAGQRAAAEFIAFLDTDEAPHGRLFHQASALAPHLDFGHGSRPAFQGQGKQKREDHGVHAEH
jgi:hypothetical protein